MLKFDKRFIHICAFLYLWLPICVWLTGWCRPIVAAPAIIIPVVVSFFAIRKEERGETEIYLPGLILMFIGTAVMLFLYGDAGRIFSDTQVMTHHYDWLKHNTMLTDLIDNDWPVYYEGVESSMLTYYTGFYMIPALIGKIAGFRAALAALVVWQFVGFILLYLTLCSIPGLEGKIRNVLCAILLLTFNYSGICVFFIEEIGRAAGENLVNDTLCIFSGDSTSPSFALVSAGMFRLFTPAFNSIPLLISSFLFLEYRDRPENWMLIWTPCLLYQPISLPVAFITAITVLVMLFIRKQVDVKRLFLFNCPLLIPTGVMLTYLSGNMLSDKPQEIGWRLNNLTDYPITTILYIMFNIAIFAWLLHKQYKEPLYWICICLSLLMIIPTYGYYHDLQLSGGMMLTGLYIFLLAKETGQKMPATPLLIFYIFAIASCIIITDNKIQTDNMLITDEDAFYAEMEKMNAVPVSDYDIPPYFEIVPASYGYGSISIFSDRSANWQPDLIYNYFTYDYKEKLFFRYFARK